MISEVGGGVRKRLGSENQSEEGSRRRLEADSNAPMTVAIVPHCHFCRQAARERGEERRRDLENHEGRSSEESTAILETQGEAHLPAAKKGEKVFRLRLEYGVFSSFHIFSYKK